MAGVLVHEWIAPAGGSENVLESMARVYPEADLLCLWNDGGARFADRSPRETWLARTPLRRTKAGALPFMPATWRSLRGDYDWALISSHLFAHHVTFGDPQLRRYVYVHTPARYLWNPELDERGRSLPVRLVAPALKAIDRRRAREGADFAANSDFVRRRIERAWGVEARVIHPPVDVELIRSRDWVASLSPADAATLAGLPDAFLLGASRFIPYKRLDLVIAAGEAVGLPVVLAGRGPELPRLRERAAAATVPIVIVEAPSTPLLRALYTRATVFVFPALEDFGIMPVEAMAAGTPVVSLGEGGTAESVVPGVSGAWADFDSPADVRRAVDEAVATDPEERRRHASRFSEQRFADELRAWVAA